jgi:hypothetical protein
MRPLRRPEWIGSRKEQDLHSHTTLEVRSGTGAWPDLEPMPHSRVVLSANAIETFMDRLGFVLSLSQSSANETQETRELRAWAGCHMPNWKFDPVRSNCFEANRPGTRTDGTTMCRPPVLLGGTNSISGQALTDDRPWVPCDEPLAACRFLPGNKVRSAKIGLSGLVP